MSIPRDMLDTRPDVYPPLLVYSHIKMINYVPCAWLLWSQSLWSFDPHSQLLTLILSMSPLIACYNYRCPSSIGWFWAWSTPRPLCCTPGDLQGSRRSGESPGGAVIAQWDLPIGYDPSDSRDQSSGRGLFGSANGTSESIMTFYSVWCLSQAAVYICCTEPPCRAN